MTGAVKMVRRRKAAGQRGWSLVCFSSISLLFLTGIKETVKENLGPFIPYKSHFPVTP